MSVTAARPISRSSRTPESRSRVGKQADESTFGVLLVLRGLIMLLCDFHLVIGRITLCRYGGVFRGLKVKASEEAGAIGTIIYSDPKDDGEVTEANGYAPYPEGPARNPSSVQRGSVQYLSSYPGDPTTPGLPAYKNATRSTVSTQHDKPVAS